MKVYINQPVAMIISKTIPGRIIMLTGLFSMTNNVYLISILFPHLHI